MLLLDLHRYFNPRSLWGAMSGSPGRRGRWYISIRAPRVGSDDLIRDEVTLGRVISIRTPRVGSDSTKRCKVLPCLHFNPHSPRGEQSWPVEKAPTSALFQSALPAWGAITVLCRLAVPLLYFNPHSPVGSDGKNQRESLVSFCIRIKNTYKKQVVEFGSKNRIPKELEPC